jgi:hypothetical protein
MDMEEEVKEAYEVVKRIDVLDVSVGTYTHSFRFCLFVYLFADSPPCAIRTYLIYGTSMKWRQSYSESAKECRDFNVLSHLHSNLSDSKIKMSTEITHLLVANSTGHR